jgi:predicted RNA-binding protein with TRAM domain
MKKNMQWDGFDDEGISRVINSKVNHDPCLGKNNGSHLTRKQLEEDVKVGMYVTISLSLADDHSSHAQGNGVVVAIEDFPKGKRLKIRHVDREFEQEFGRGGRYTVNVSTWNMNADGVNRFSASGSRMKRMVSCAWDVSSILSNK